MPEFKIGQTVRLASGGPVMTVDSVKQGNGKYFCAWFNKEDEYKREQFQADAIVQATPQKPYTGV